MNLIVPKVLSKYMQQDSKQVHHSADFKLIWLIRARVLKVLTERMQIRFNQC